MAVLGLDEAKAYLRITNAVDDSQLTGTINAAETIIAARIGPLEPTPVTRRVHMHGRALVVDPPAVSLTSVVDDGGTALDVAALYLDPETGVITYNDGSDFVGRYFTVTYERGRETCPDDLLEAVRALVKHLWSPRRGTAGRPGASASDGPSDSLPGAGYLLPFRVEQLLAPYLPTGLA